MTRLLIIGDPALRMLQTTLGPFMEAARAHPQIDVVGLCDAGRREPQPRREAVRKGIRRLFNAEPAPAVPGPSVMRRVARQYDLPLLTPPGRDVNAPAFLEELRRLRPNALLSLGCLQVFRPALIDFFEIAVNFHNGSLPDYRGLNATSWSLYNGEKQTGYSFHRITPGIDEGPILVEGAVPVTPDLRLAQASMQKNLAAADAAPRVLEAIVRRAPGRVQTGGRYYSRQDSLRITRIERPELLPSSEIVRRLACFGLLTVQIEGQNWEITKLAERGRPSFPTADGRLSVERAMFLPPWLYRVYRIAPR